MSKPASRHRTLPRVGTVTRVSVATVVCIATTVAMAAPYQVKDILSSSSGEVQSDPQGFFEMGGVVYFVANDGAHGLEPWRTDGTAAGTVLLKDVVPGPAPAPGRSSSLRREWFAVAGESLFFFSGGRGLWRSDETASGTELLTRFPTTRGVALGGLLMARIDDGVHGEELWRTDGTVAGTYLVKDITPGPGASHPQEMLSIGDTLYFTILREGTTELWKSDATEGGTLRVRDDLTSVGWLVEYQGMLFFSGSTAEYGGELWKSDGTVDGTVMVKDLLPGPSGAAPRVLTVVDGTLFFSAEDDLHGRELWRSDGTSLGTVLVKDILPGVGNSAPRYLTDVGGTLFLSAETPGAGHELWRSDGTEAGTELVRDINPGIASSNPEFFADSGDALLFSAFDEESGRELWRSDGSAAGTVRLMDIRSGSASSSPRWLTGLDGRVFFSAAARERDRELWVSDGTAAGTVLVKNIGQGSSDSLQYDLLTDVGGTLFFRARDDDHGHELWRSDGTAAGTALVKDINPGPESSFEVNCIDGTLLTEQAAAAGVLFLSVREPATGRELWRSDGTEQGTYVVKDIQPGAASSSPTELVDLAGILFFQTTGHPWRSDGTEAGTVLLKRIVNPPEEEEEEEEDEGDEDALVDPTCGPVPLGGTTRHFTPVGDKLFFIASGDGLGLELWISDGTEAGTNVVKDIRPGRAGSDPEQLIEVDGRLFFSADDGLAGRELWTSDGTETGTTRVRDILPGAGGSEPKELTNVAGKLFFAADDGEIGRELWTSDATAAGTVLVRDILPGLSGTGIPLGSDPHELADRDGTLVFAATAEGTGTELWKSDGTADGTTLLRDIVPGAAGSFPASLTEFDDLVLFAAVHPALGLELWETDGTAAGTVPAHDIAPGPSSSCPRFLTVSGDRLFFAASDSIAGEGSDTELWALHANRPPVAVCRDVIVQADAECLANASVSDGVSDPDDDPVMLEQLPAAPYRLGETTVTLTATDDRGVSGSCSATVSVIDRAVPEGNVTFPPSSYCGPGPVTVTDDFGDNCDDDLERTYAPGPGPSYETHGNHDVTLTATDDSGNEATTSISFTIDTEKPHVELVTPLPGTTLPGGLAFDVTFLANDDDSAHGDIVHEVVRLDGCVLFDGFAVGNGDGLLSDEILRIDLPELCRASRLCGFDELLRPELRVEALDCAGNLGTARRVLEGGLSLGPAGCSR